MPTKTTEQEPTLVEGPGNLILVVDDDESIRELTQAVLTKHGFGVLLAADGVQALALHAQHGGRIKLVLTDLRMPNMDGWTLIQALGQVAPALKVIVSSSVDLNNPGPHEPLRALAVSGILRKPYTTQALLSILHEALRTVG